MPVDLPVYADSYLEVCLDTDQTTHGHRTCKPPTDSMTTPDDSGRVVGVASVATSRKFSGVMSRIHSVGTTITRFGTHSPVGFQARNIILIFSMVVLLKRLTTGKSACPVQPMSRYIASAKTSLEITLPLTATVSWQM